MVFLPGDKRCPPPQWIEAVRAKFPTEREWDRILTGKQERRSGPGYAPLAVGDILEALQSFLRHEIEGEFSLSDAGWLAGGASKLQIAFTLGWDKPGEGRTSERLVLRMEPPASAVETSRCRAFELLRAMPGVLPVPAAHWKSEERRVGKAGARTCRSRWSQVPNKK